MGRGKKRGRNKRNRQTHKGKGRGTKKNNENAGVDKKYICYLHVCVSLGKDHLPREA
jgi:hypothetical protein